MPDASQEPVAHISSAVVRTLPAQAAAVAKVIAGFRDTEVFHSEGGYIVVVLEGPDTGTLGARLSEISLLEGVLSASMVYERVETLASLGEVP